MGGHLTCVATAFFIRLDWLSGFTNNERVFRRAIALGLTAAVQAAALGAPLVHAHVDGHAGDHHGANVLHAHVSGHASPHRHASDGDTIAGGGTERTVFLQHFVAETVASFGAPGLPAASFELVTPDETPARRGLQVAHGHDPPPTTRPPARAPPSRLS